MDIHLRLATSDDKEKLNNLIRRYFAELIKNISPNPGLTPEQLIHKLEKYWCEKKHWPYLIEANEKIAGFCFLRDFPEEPGNFDIEEFFIANEFRRQGVGTQCLARLIALHPGAWIVRVLKENEKALRFWLHAVEVCQGENYLHQLEPYNEKERHFIRFTTQ